MNKDMYIEYEPINPRWDDELKVILCDGLKGPNGKIIKDVSKLEKDVMIQSLGIPESKITFTTAKVDENKVFDCRWLTGEKVEE